MAVIALGSACGRELPPQLLVVEERVELCAAAPHGKPLEVVQATQWRLAIEPDAYELPDPRPRPSAGVLALEGDPMPQLLDVYDVDEARPFDAPLEGAVVEHANDLLQQDDDVDSMFVWSHMHWTSRWPFRLSLAIEAESGERFDIDDGDVRFSCPDRECPGRGFEACDPGGPTVRTRATLDRGEIVLDVRHVEGDPANGELHRVAFVASEVHLDDVDVVQHDFFRLLHSADASEIGDGSYAVLAPELEAAGLGCGIAITDIGTQAPRAFTVDCALQELEPLVISAVDRER